MYIHVCAAAMSLIEVKPLLIYKIQDSPHNRAVLVKKMEGILLHSLHHIQKKS